ncbi:orotidine-5'-phosphate decarboxylase [Patescibacteria group bacterium]|nr:orotidine-5'-phosphate decarboxylase [Patescibacteria group bacterium]
MRNFMELLRVQWAKGNFVCVGLDSEFDKIPESAHRMKGISTTIVAFNRAIVETTKDIVCAYKPNAAFYEAHGSIGWVALRDTIIDIHRIAPNVPVILDAKRADIGNTNNGYVQMAFDYLKADAITVHPYLGQEALQPFLDRADKGVIVLCRTSNPGAGEFQDEDVAGDNVPNGYMPLYKYVAYQVSHKWNREGNCALVVGATYPDELCEVRGLIGDMPILIPGVGFQQKDVPIEKQVEQVVSAGKNSHDDGMIINSSRGIIFASKGADFAEAARRETLKLHDLINQFR